MEWLSQHCMIYLCDVTILLHILVQLRLFKLCITYFTHQRDGWLIKLLVRCIILVIVFKLILSGYHRHIARRSASGSNHARWYEHIRRHVCGGVSFLLLKGLSRSSDPVITNLRFNSLLEFGTSTQGFLRYTEHPLDDQRGSFDAKVCGGAF